MGLITLHRGGDSAGGAALKLRLYLYFWLAVVVALMTLLWLALSAR
jgi:hypothetical protein